MNINELSYPDLVAVMRQENTPPGGGATVDEWVKHSNIESNSKILDLACSTGFSSRYIAHKIDIDAVGIDLSSRAISVANEKVRESEYLGKLAFKTMDATKIEGIGPFTHVLGGCNFAFIQDRELGLQKVVEHMEDSGQLCTANFHYTHKPPQQLLDKVEKALGWRPNPTWDMAYWDNFFSGEFNIQYSRLVDLNPMSDSRLAEIVDKQFQLENLRQDYGLDQLAAMKNKYLEIRSVLNEHRVYQGYSVQVWRKK